MQHTLFALETSDGVRLFAQLWQPDHPPRAVVCLVHGHGEHSGRYEHVAQALTGAGYALQAFDLRGHGQSPGSRGDAPSYQTLLNDVALALDTAAGRFPDLPRFLYGHSLGAILAVDAALSRTGGLSGVIAAGPPFRTSLEEQTLKLLMVRVLGRVLPSLTLPTGLDPKHLSRTPDVVADYVNDPLVHDRLSLGLAQQLLGAKESIMERAADLRTPVLLMHGTEDQLGFADATSEFGRCVPGDCTVTMWEGLCHEIHNEPEQQEVIQTMIDWMDARVAEPS